jgi:GNAT superfamily N-acetyltransferase
MDDGMTVMTMADADEVAALWEAVGMWPHVGEDRAWLEGALARNEGCALVWRDGGRVVGTVIGAWDGLRGWVYRLAVAEPHRGKGLGGALLAEVETRLWARGVRQINLMVYEENGSAEAFYLRRGYERSPVKVLRKRSQRDGEGSERG